MHGGVMHGGAQRQRVAAAGEGCCWVRIRSTGSPKAWPLPLHDCIRWQARPHMSRRGVTRGLVLPRSSTTLSDGEVCGGQWELQARGCYVRICTSLGEPRHRTGGLLFRRPPCSAGRVKDGKPEALLCHRQQGPRKMAAAGGGGIVGPPSNPLCCFSFALSINHVRLPRLRRAALRRVAPTSLHACP
jgi:hypothetical protein